MPAQTLYDAEGNEVEIPDAADLRGQLEDANKRLKEAEKLRIKAEQELAPIRAKEREDKLTTALGALGAPAVKTWLRVQPDVEPNEETVNAFVEEFGFAPAAPVETPAANASTQFVFTPTTPGTDGGAAGPAKITEAEYTRLMSTNPSQAVLAASQGLVEWKHPEVAAMAQRTFGRT